MSLSPIGLLFAAAVAIFLAFGQVTNKKVVEGQNVVAAVFWIRAFAAPIFAVVLLGLAWSGSPPLIHAPASLRTGDVLNLPELAASLRDPANPAAKKIAESLSPNTRTKLAGYQPGTADPDLLRDLVQDLNSDRVIGGTLLYTAQDFAGIALSAETQRLLGSRLRGQVRSYANRLLLRDLFPDAIASDTTCNLFGVAAWPVRPEFAFGVYLIIEIILVAWSQYLTTLALKVAPISLCVPFTAFAPIFVLGGGYLMLGELPTIVGMMGIALIVLGGVLMHRKLFAVSWKAPILAIVKEPGSRFMVLSVLLGAVFSPLEKQLVLMSDSLTAVFCYGVGTVLALLILCVALRVDLAQVMRERRKWAVLCGLLDALMTLAQFIAVMYLPVVIAMCIKRAGIVLTVLAGWLFFRERGITDRLIGSLAMAGGIAIFYLPLDPRQATVLMFAVVGALAVALYLTRHPRSVNTLKEEPIEVS